MFGGRPMKLIESCLFMDIVVHKPVNLYEDKKGRYWMSTNRWGWFGSRVATTKHEAMPIEKEANTE